MKVMDLVPDGRGIFISRENRFLGIVDIDGHGRGVPTHIHDPGRLREVLFKGNDVLLRHVGNIPGRKTEWDVIAGLVGDRWVLANSSYHRRVADWVLEKGVLPFPTKDGELRPEARLGNSRIDYLVDGPQGRTWIEVKGCSLSRDGVALFPDAPTLRGAKHITELMDAMEKGDDACLLFLVFAPQASRFSPNFHTDPYFSTKLEEALHKGMKAFPLLFSYDGLTINYEGEIPLIFQKH